MYSTPVARLSPPPSVATDLPGVSVSTSICSGSSIALPFVPWPGAAHSLEMEVEALKEELDGFPTSGKPLAVKFICSDLPEILVNEFLGCQVTGNWEVCHLVKASQVLTGVHASVQRLYHAGSELTPGMTLREAVGVPDSCLPPRVAVHVLVDRERFPQKLGPFALAEVPLKADDLMLPQFTDGVFHWALRSEVLERFGLRGALGTATAQCSPMCGVTLPPADRAAAGIPEAAVDFAWSYPIANWEQVEHDPHVLDNWAECSSDHTIVKDFLQIGGFIYRDANRKVTHVAALRAGETGLHFGTPKRWVAAWTRALLGDGRFQRVTIGPLKAAGVRFFCWLLPGERFLDRAQQPLSSQPEVPHGGFAYLFHELDEASPLELGADRYFPLASIQGSAQAGEPLPLVNAEEEAPSDLVGHTSAQLHVHSICLQDV